MTYRIPVSLDLPATLPSGPLEVELDLPLLAAHTGAAGAPAESTLSAALADGRAIPVQYLPAFHNGADGTAGAGHPRVLLSLPAHAATAGQTHLELIVALEGGDHRHALTPRAVLSQGPESVEIWLDGTRFALYRYNTSDPELPRPYFHPILGPTGAPLTQDGEIPGTKQAHFHHTGLVLAHQKFTDGNNWQIGPNFSRMRHQCFDVMQSGPLAGRFVERLEWLNVKGDRVLFREVRTVTVPMREASGRTIDIDTTITCGDTAVVWEATPYHLLAVRPPDEMLAAHGGTITNSEGMKNPADGVPAQWIDYSGPHGGGTAGVALFNHPSNLRHPTPCLNFANQTIGLSATHREPYAWKPGESLRFRFRALFHAGDAAQAQVQREYEAYAQPPKAQIGPPVSVS